MKTTRRKTTLSSPHAALPSNYTFTTHKVSNIGTREYAATERIKPDRSVPVEVKMFPLEQLALHTNHGSLPPHFLKYRHESEKDFKLLRIRT